MIITLKISLQYIWYIKTTINLSKMVKYDLQLDFKYKILSQINQMQN